MSRAMAVAACLIVLIACAEKGNVNGPTIAGAADISGKWAGHGDGQQSFDSLTLSITQSSGTIGGGGVYWLASSPKPIKFIGSRVKDSLYVNMPDSSGTPTDTLKFLGIVSKDAFGDELFGSVGQGSFTAANGITFVLHRRP